MNIAIIISLQNSIGLFLEFAKKEKYYVRSLPPGINRSWNALHSCQLCKNVYISMPILRTVT